jgi:hypothetical protein
LATVVAVEIGDLAHRAAYREGARNDCAGTRPGDQIEAFTEIEAFDAAHSRELRDEAVEEGRGVDATHAAAIQAQHPVRLGRGVRRRLVRLSFHNHARKSHNLIQDSFVGRFRSEVETRREPQFRAAPLSASPDIS